MTGLTRTKGIRSRSSRKAKEIRDSRPVVADVFERDGGCVLRGHSDVAGACFGEPRTPHHLQKQSRKRGEWTHRGLVTLCSFHNSTWVEGWPNEAKRLGLVVNDTIDPREAWTRMRTHRLAVGTLVEPCPYGGQPPDTDPEAGRYWCLGCGHGGFTLTVALDGGPEGVLPPHDREVGW